jgi:hypothetical protein
LRIASGIALGGNGSEGLRFAARHSGELRAWFMPEAFGELFVSVVFVAQDASAMQSDSRAAVFMFECEWGFVE